MSMVYDRLAALFRYPSKSYTGDLDACRQALVAADPAAAEQIAGFSAAIGGWSVGALEELFTETFDMNPACSLEVGWHLFGEEYERGTFLVRMRAALREHGLAESTELPDHLTHVLAVLGRMEESAGRDFASACVQPAVEKICAALADRDNPYEQLLGALRTFLAARYGSAVPQSPARPRRVLPFPVQHRPSATE